MKYLTEIKECFSRKMTQLTVQLRCLYTKAASMGNRQELEATLLLEIYDLSATTELGGMNPMTGVQLSMATGCLEGTGEKGEVVELPSTPRAGLSVESCFFRTDMSRSRAWDKNQRPRQQRETCVGAYRHQLVLEPIDEALLLQLQEALCSQATVLQGDLNCSEICWKSSMMAVGNPGDSWNVCRITS